MPGSGEKIRKKMIKSILKIEKEGIEMTGLEELIRELPPRELPPEFHQETEDFIIFFDREAVQKAQR
jgi:hypothetical protein